MMMGIGRSKTNATGKGFKRSSGTVTLIGEGSRMEGEMNSQADIRIEGEFVGSLYATGEVAVGEKGMVHCKELKARDVIIAGKLEGFVQADGFVRITSTGRLTGRIVAGTLMIEQGAIFEGQSLMTQPSALQLQPSETASESAAMLAASTAAGQAPEAAMTAAMAE
ncbi:polymer-forming cytoskeletal protein [Paenibacillus sp. YYML68]|uniref:bactofilin family protein n=1 Tax=Paenibacillus sp. YYML68 TaxID=2909250 RepID=UPI0024922A1F|nr:polymer-forming cytoskeletal protein [Paenibacillus sp. YYML68]